MIGWYIDVGLLSMDSPTNVNQLTPLDTHRPFIMLEDKDIDKGYLFEHLNEGLGKQEQIERIDKIFGIGAPFVTCWPVYRENDLITQLYPSLAHVAPKTWAALEDKAKPFTMYCYCKSLKYVEVRTRTTSGESVKTFIVNDDGSLSGKNTSYFLLACWFQGKMATKSGLAPLTSRIFIKDASLPLDDINNYWSLTDYTTVSSAKEVYTFSVVTTSGNFNRVAGVFSQSGVTKPDFTGEPGPDNPYEPGGPSGPTNPDIPPGTFDDESDAIPDSPLPTLSAANTGFTRIYNPTLSQVQALARYLWTDESVIETIWNHIKQFFENPMEAIIGFNLVPVPVPDGGIENFALMYIDTGVQMTVAANQFVDLDCGTVELKRYYGSALDQSPYTKVSCYLPYIGTVNLNTDEVMGTTLQVKYRVDIVSGSCVAKIFVDGNCLYQYSGHCAITIPISSADFSSYVSAAISVGKLAAAAITAGAGAAMAAGVAEVSQQTNQVVTTTQVTNTARNPSTGRQITTGTTTTVQTRESPADQSSTQASFSGLSPQNIANTVGAIMSSKPHIEHSGSFSGNSGYLGVRRPFLIIERPNMCMPENYQALNGFPTMITMELSTCKGFTRVQQVQLTGMGRATNPEQAEILELLKSGVIL